MNTPEPESLDTRVLRRIVDADLTPSQLAAELNLTLTEVSRWILDADNLRTVEGLSRLADVRAQMILSRYRATAAAHLITIATAKEPTELSRKACVDLLTTDLDVFPSVGQSEDSSTSASTASLAPSEETILAALERLGAEER